MEGAETEPFDHSGWAHIHHAANKGFPKSIERFVHADQDSLELETRDELHSTPFLIAVSSGNLDSIKCLLKLGAKIDVINTQNHGAVELCAIRQSIHLLEYFIDLNDAGLPVWKNLLRFLSSDSEEEAVSAGKCLQTLTQCKAEGEINPNWEAVYNSGGVPVIVKVAKGNIADDAKVPAFHTLLNIIERSEVKEQILSSGGIQAFIRLLKSPVSDTVQLAAQILKELATVRDYADQEVQNNIIPSLLNVMKANMGPEVLVEIVDCLGNIAEASSKHQNVIGSTHGLIPGLVNLYEAHQKDKALLYSLNKAVGKISRNDASNQLSFVEHGVTPHVKKLMATKNKDLQISSVEAIHLLADKNAQTQQAILEVHAQDLLIHLLEKAQGQLQIKSAMALWALAGDDSDEQRNLAEKMKVGLLIEFVNSMSEDLHYIGSEGLGVLAQGPLSYQTEIANANGIHPLVRHLRSDKEYIVQSIIRTLRYMCVGVGYIPHPKNQNMISHSRGIKFLIALMVHSKDEIIQVESALTLGYVSLGNQEILDEINSNIDFSYVRILKMMYAHDDQVRLLAGSALAAFAYNNISQQKEIAEQGGVRFNCFVPFLQSDDEYYRCNAAFQVVVLARIIPDEEQAQSSAIGIKLLVDLLQDSQSNLILALAADCIARLAHTRAGVPNAIISISAIDFLSKLLLSPAENVRGCAAIALSYLAYNHAAERQLLNKCRSDPILMKFLLRYNKKNKLPPGFLDGWRHYKRIGLPPIEEGRINLIAPKGRPETKESDSTGIVSPLSVIQSSNSQSNPVLEEGQETVRSSQSSRLTHRSDSLSKSQLSMDRHSQQSQSSLLQADIPMSPSEVNIPPSVATTEA
ncbi:hypothetical protein CHS0354_035060 [Potamilus streckersoni]|uniref:Ankyrin and armadillo repeat-containing protein n=1 Tax=Potamilus streckersoni TaxID=2493646 RepID=A0AAE0S7B2_9BIVA|nr:hypothetical protein CHS0354_035060 [Potamilus streckersoni]